VIAEIRAVDPGFEVIVVDDGSKDRTARVAAAAGAHVVRLPYNLGIGGAVQTGLQYARDTTSTSPFRSTATLSTARRDREAPRADRRGRADLVVGSRFLEKCDYRASFARLVGIKLFALSCPDRAPAVTDNDLGLPRGQPPRDRALRLRLSARLPGGRGNVLVFKHPAASDEVPVRMRNRNAGVSSITFADVRLLHDQSHARALRGPVPPLTDTFGGK